MRAQTAIVGVSDIVPDRRKTIDNYWQLAADASLQALDDCGMGVRDLDGVVFTSSGYPAPHPTFPTSFCQQLGIAPAWMETAPHGGHQMGSIIWRAAVGIAHGLASRVLLVSIDNRESRLSRGGVVNKIAAQNTDLEFEYPSGPLFPSSMALIAQRQMHEYGMTERQMAAVAVSNRKWAALHSKATMKTPLAIEDVLASRMITTPLHLLDICLVGDGGGAMIMIGADEAREWKTRPAYLLGFGDCAETQGVVYLEDYTRPAMLRRAAEQAMAMAGIQHQDVDVLYAYDPCTSHVIWGLEQMGFCHPGEGGPFVAEGNLEPGGSMPCNTHGGLLSYCHPGVPGGFLGLVEAVRQLRGECGERQVPGATVAMSSQMGGFMAWGVNILSSEP